MKKKKPVTTTLNKIQLEDLQSTSPILQLHYLSAVNAFPFLKPEHKAAHHCTTLIYRNVLQQRRIVLNEYAGNETNSKSLSY